MVSDFVAANPSAVAPLLEGDSVHLWRLPYHRAHGRAPLRALLAAYLGVEPDALLLRNDEYGKPRLVDPVDANADKRNIKIRSAQEAMPKQTTRDRTSETLRFSWSHGGDLALAALARGVEPGVDVEPVRASQRALELARRFFDPDEAQALAACPEEERDATFLRLWCAKEAVLKALGRGIAFGLERVAFARHGTGWRPVRFVAEAGAAEAWQLCSLVPAAGYLGALAWRGPPRKVRAWRPLASD
ncbi:MAG: 4'-phosphopantetheinyl transferase superfamily protein [Rhodanobacteraceae bacterium]